MTREDYIKGDNGFCNSLRFCSFLLRICLQSLLFHSLCLSIGFLVIGTKKINLIVIVFRGGLFSRGCLSLDKRNVVCGGFGLVAGKRREFGFVAGNVFVPPCCVGVG
jgi:hypothetical protein